MKEKKRLTPEEELRIDRRIQISVIIIAVIMLLYLFWALRSGKNPGRPFSILILVFVVFYWLVGDIFAMFWKHGFAGRTEAQKKAYYMSVVMDAVAYGGFAYFLLGRNPNSSLIGAVIYMVGIMNARNFRKEYAKEAPEEERETAESGESGDSLQDPASSDSVLPTAANRLERMSASERLARLSAMTPDDEETEQTEEEIDFVEEPEEGDS